MKKVITTDEISLIIKRLKSEKKKIVLVGGCFDILHEGHNEFLAAAKNQGDTLVVMLESDESVKSRKGNDRPVNSQKVRAAELSKSPYVDIVLVIPPLKTDLEYYEMTNMIEPDIIAVTKNDPAFLHKTNQAKQVGGTVVEVIDRLPNLSTTQIIRDNLEV